MVHKEFKMLKSTVTANVSRPMAKIKALQQTMSTILKSYQLFVANFFNPNTPYSRLLMKWETGIGKTLAACTIAASFLDIIRDLNVSSEFNGSVFILGFTEEIFKTELLKFPGFGFITEQEKAKLNMLREQAMAGSRKFQDEYRELRSRYRRRLVSRKGNGYFKFYGYRAIANRIFISKLNVVAMDRMEIIDKINSGEIKLNSEFLDEFANSLIICDEIHNLYNSVEKNNWGIAIELIMNYNPSCRALFLSATPINSSPTEVVDLLNLLLPRDKYPIMNHSDFFNEDQELLASGAERLKALLRGRVSFVRDVNPNRFASKELVGEALPGVPLLRFIRCKISPFHQRAYDENYGKTGTLPPDGVYLNDVVFPDPHLDKPYDGLGIFRTKDVRTNYSEAKQDWKSKHHLQLVDDEIQGAALSADAKLADISSKYFTMIQHLKAGLKKGAGKTFIYHNSKQISGVFLIDAILQENGFITIGEDPNAETLCAFCGEVAAKHKAIGGAEKDRPIRVEVDGAVWNVVAKGEKINHKKLEGEVLVAIGDRDGTADPSQLLFGSAFLHLKSKASGGDDEDSDDDRLSGVLEAARIKVCDCSRRGGGDHPFTPARYIMVHGNMDKKEVDQLLEKFNRASNTDGGKIMYIVGSRFMRESYTLVAVRNIYVMSRPDNISMLMQIIGRAVRDGVHELLPQDQRHVYIKLFVSSLAKGLSQEEQKYSEKIALNKIVRQIEAIINAAAIDAIVNREMIWRRKAGPPDELDIEPFTPATKELKGVALKESSFWAYHSHMEVNYVEYIIKRLYVEKSPIWKYADLWREARAPPFDTSIDTTMLDQELFNIALNNLIYIENGLSYRPLFARRSMITIDGRFYTIRQFGDLYILCSFDPVSKDVSVDIESFDRIMPAIQQKQIELRSYLIYDEKSNYSNKRDRFIAKWGMIDFKNLKNAIYMFGLKFHLLFIEEVISYIHDFLLKKEKRIKAHDFYFRMLQYYDLYGLLIFASDVAPAFMPRYKALAKFGEEKQHVANNEIQRMITRSSPTWITTGMVQEYDRMSKDADAIARSGQKPKAYMFPVGHHMDQHTRLYSAGQWSIEMEYSKLVPDAKENAIIVGYEERYDDYIDIKFKLRSPIQNIQKHRDTRLIEKGIVCQTKNKVALVEICKKLHIPLTGKEGSVDLCNAIKTDLLHREAKERNKTPRVRWFYSFFDEQPMLT